MGRPRGWALVCVRCLSISPSHLVSFLGCSLLHKQTCCQCVRPVLQTAYCLLELSLSISDSSCHPLVPESHTCPSRCHPSMSLTTY